MVRLAEFPQLTVPFLIVFDIPAFGPMLAGSLARVTSVLLPRVDRAITSLSEFEQAFPAVRKS